MNDLVRDDLLLDALAAGLPAAGDPVGSLLGALRLDLDAAVAPAGAVPGVPVLPVRRARRSVAVVALAAAAGLAIGAMGAAAVAQADRPGDLLHAAHEVAFGHDDRTAAEAATLLDQVAGALARGDRAGARRLLAKAAPVVARVPDARARAALRARLDTLTRFAAEPPPTPKAAPTAAPTAGQVGHAGPDGQAGQGGRTGRPGPTGTEPSARPESQDEPGSGESGEPESREDRETGQPGPAESSHDGDAARPADDHGGD
jgi:hypothetical protein